MKYLTRPLSRTAKYETVALQNEDAAACETTELLWVVAPFILLVLSLAR